MPRPRGFDESDVLAAAAAVFVRLGYEGTSIDDLVRAVGVHRGSLYRVFASKLALFHRALDSAVEGDVLPWIERLSRTADAPPPPAFDLVLLAAIERAPVDPVVAAQVRRVRQALADALDTRASPDRSAALVGRHLFRRAERAEHRN